MRKIFVTFVKENISDEVTILYEQFHEWSVKFV